MNHLKRKAIFVIISLVLVSLIGTIFSIKFFKNYYKDAFPIRNFEEKTIPLPGRCKYIDAGGIDIVKFETTKTAAEVTEFYDNYLKTLRKMINNKLNGRIGYFVESMDYILVKYEVFDHGNKTIFTVSYDLVKEDWEFIDP